MRAANSGPLPGGVPTRRQHLDNTTDRPTKCGRQAASHSPRQVAGDMPLAEARTTVDEILATNQRPRHIDAKLLAMSRNEIGRDLAPIEKRIVRNEFLAALQERLTSSEARPE